jgi:hypothetical protein
MQPSDPAVHSDVSIVPEAPAGITHLPDLQTPLAQSGPVLQVVFGSGTLGMQSPPWQSPLWQSLPSLQREPAGEPGITPEPAPPELSPPLAVEPPEAVEPPVAVTPPMFRPSEPPSVEPCPAQSCEVQFPFVTLLLPPESLELQEKGNDPTSRSPKSRT